jgi:hypothetical protein
MFQIAVLKMSTAVKLRRQRNWQQTRSLVPFNVSQEHMLTGRQGTSKPQDAPHLKEYSAHIWSEIMNLSRTELKTRSCYFGLISEIIVWRSYNKAHKIKA